MQATNEQLAEDREAARRKGLAIYGFPRPCECGGRAYGSGTAQWQNRVVCLKCGREWSQ